VQRLKQLEHSFISVSFQLRGRYNAVVDNSNAASFDVAAAVAMEWQRAASEI